MYASSYTTVPIARYYVLKYNVKPLHCKSFKHIQLIYYFEEYDVHNLIPYGIGVSIRTKGTLTNRIHVHDTNMTNGLYTTICQGYGLALSCLLVILFLMKPRIKSLISLE